MPNYIFIGDKKSSIYTIDIDKGAIVSRHSSNEDDDIGIRRPIQTDNLLTVIRVDYILTSINKREGNKYWNMTVSEVMAIQKGTKSELTLRNDNMIYSSGMESRINQLIANSDNSIVSIHKYNKDNYTPVKIYNHMSNNNLEDFIDSNRTSLIDNNYYRIYEKYLKWTAERNYGLLRQKSFLHFLVYKFWELYYMNDEFLFYFTIILVLIGIVFLLISLIIKYVRKNSALKEKLKEYRKISDDNKNKEALVLKSNVIEDSKEEEVDTIIVERSSSQELAVYNDNQGSNIVGPNPNFLFNQIIDLNAKDFEKENKAITSVKLFQDKDGSLVKEEYRMLRTTYENNDEIKNRFDRLEEQLEKITKSDKRARTKSERHQRNTTEQSISPSRRKARSKEKKSGFIIHAVQNKSETNIVLQPNGEDDYPVVKTTDDSSKIEYKSRGVSNCRLRNRATSIYKSETSKNKEEKYNNALSSGKKNNRSQSIIFKECNEEQSNMTPIQHSKRKYNYKEYNLVQQKDDIKNKILKINTTYIDEGRLEKNFEGFEKIGQGGFGSVFKAKHKIDDSMYAIKMIKLKVAQSQNLMEYKELKEVRTMMKLNHKNVVRYYTCWFQLQLLGINLDNMDNEASVTQSYLRSIISESKQHTLAKRNNTLNRITNDYESYLKRGKSEEKNSNVWDWNNVDSKKTSSIVLQADIDRALSVSFEKQNDYDLDEDNNMYSYDESSVIKSNKKFKEPLYDVFFFMQMEFCDGLPLNEYLDSNKYTGIDPKIIYSFFKQIASGVNHIHKNNVIHRDLK